MTLIKADRTPIIDAGENALGLSKHIHPLADVFDHANPEHILETNLYCHHETTWTPAITSNIKVAVDHDLFEGAKDTMFQPPSVLDHKVTKVLVRKVETHPQPTIKLNKCRQVQVKVLWKNGEISWVNANALRLQVPYPLVAYAVRNSLSSHPDFTWTQAFQDNDLDQHTQELTTKHNQGPVYKFGIQVPKNAAHAKKLDKLSNSNLWDEAKKKELKLLKDFNTFRVLEDHERVPERYIRMPITL